MINSKRLGEIIGQIIVIFLVVVIFGYLFLILHPAVQVAVIIALAAYIIYELFINKPPVDKR